MAEQKPMAVYIEWRDCHSRAAWALRENMKDTFPLPLFTVGWLVHEDAECVVVSTTWDPRDGSFLTSTSIPKGCITKQKRMEPP